jgi:hypothetical protein
MTPTIKGTKVILLFGMGAAMRKQYSVARVWFQILMMFENDANVFTRQLLWWKSTSQRRDYGSF